MRIYIAIAFFVSVSAALAQVRISEVMASNSTVIFDEDRGEYADWVELTNYGSDTVDLMGWYLSDSRLDWTKWQLTSSFKLGPNEAKLIWCDDGAANIGDSVLIETTQQEVIAVETHASFKLKSAGEFISLTRPNFQVEDSVAFAAQERDVSWGLDSAGAQRGCLTIPSPGKRNTTTLISIFEDAERPVFSLSPGRYPGQVSVEILSSANAEIRYTINGRLPVFNSPLYTGPISVSSTTTIKATAIEEGKPKSGVAVASYLIGQAQELPTVSLSCDARLLDDFGFGLFNRSLKDKEIPISVEMFAAGDRKWSVQSGMEIFGTNILFLDQKPMSFRLKEKYGDEILNYPLFPDRSNVEYTHFVLRNGGNDNPYTMLRDGFFGELVKGKVDVDYQAYRPVRVMLNGDYWGMYHFREKINEEHISRTHKIAENRMDVLEENQEVKSGNGSGYKRLLSEVELLRDTSSLKSLEMIMDVDEYINYAILKIYAGYILLENNNKFWSSQDDMKWRWVAFDLEHGFQCCQSHNYHENTLAVWLDGTQQGLAEWSFSLFSDLMANIEFRDRFVARFQTQLQTVYTQERAIQTIDSMQNYVLPEMNPHIFRWGSPPSFNSWLQHVELMREYARQRPAFLWDHLNESLGLDELDTLLLSVSGKGRIEMDNTLWTDSSKTGAFSRSIPLTLKPVPGVGYQFLNWSDGSIEAERTVTSNEFDTLVANFIVGGPTIVAGNIVTDSVLTLAKSPYRFNGALVVDSNARLTIEAGVEVMFGPTSQLMVYGGLHVEGEENHPVILSGLNPTLNSSVFQGNEAWWGIVAHNPTDSVVLKHLTITDAEPDPQEVGALDFLGADVVIDALDIHSRKQPIYHQGGTIMVSSSKLSMEVTGDIINVVEASMATISDNVFLGNKAEDVDAIDLDGVDSARVIGNMILRLEGFNSDGIDLGEGSQGVLVERNLIENCSDKGVSVGQKSRCILMNNTIIGCGQGIGIKDDSSYARLMKQTFAFNDIALAVFEKDKGKGGGGADASSSLFLHNVNDIWIDDKSSAGMRYCFSDTASIEGDFNIQGDPMVVNLGTLDLSLQQDSPLLDGGDPSDPQDDDLSRSDIGAEPWIRPASSIVFNEINYHSDSSNNSGDWLELYTADQVDVSEWSLTDHSGVEFTFSNGTELTEEGYYVLAKSPSRFSELHPAISIIPDSLPFGLSNRSERLSLIDANGMTRAIIRYEDKSPWCTESDGGGKTIELVGEDHDHALATNWSCSTVYYGTPGRQNSVITGNRKSWNDLTVSLFPNPVENVLFLEFPYEGSWTVQLLNQMGQSLIKSATASSKTSIQMSDVHPGLYIINVVGPSQESFSSLLVVH